MRSKIRRGISPRARPSPRRKPSPRKRPSPRPSPRARPSPRPRPPIRPRPLIPIKAKAIRRRKERAKKKAKVGYDVFVKRVKFKGKKAPRFIKANIKPLTKKQALNRGGFVVDNTTGRTFKIKRVGKVKKLGKLTKKESKYFTKHRKKFRAFKIRKGVKKPIVRKFIERKGKFLIDTRGEKRGLKVSKLIKQLKKPSRPKPVRRLTPFQLQEVRLKNLAKARKTLKQMRKPSSNSVQRKSNPISPAKQKGFFGARSGGQPIKRKSSALQLKNLKLGREKRLRDLRKK